MMCDPVQGYGVLSAATNMNLRNKHERKAAAAKQYRISTFFWATQWGKKSDAALNFCVLNTENYSTWICAKVFSAARQTLKTEYYF